MSTKASKRKRTKASASEPTVQMPAAEPHEAVETEAAAPDVPVGEAAEPTRGSEPVVVLSSNCTVKDATALKGQLMRLLDEPACVAIDAKSVARVDTATIQLLGTFVRDRAACNLGVTWIGAPQPLLAAARLLGVSSLLALPVEVAS